jgi:hypothetical protein
MEFGKEAVLFFGKIWILKMKNFNVFVDVDGTLYSYIRQTNTDIYEKRQEILEFLAFLKNAGAKIYAWSGGGGPYAENMIRQLKINSDLFDGYFSKLDYIPFEIDLTIDDEEYNAKGKLNLKLVQK